MVIAIYLQFRYVNLHLWTMRFFFSKTDDAAYEHEGGSSMLIILASTHTLTLEQVELIYEVERKKNDKVWTISPWITSTRKFNAYVNQLTSAWRGPSKGNFKKLLTLLT